MKIKNVNYSQDSQLTIQKLEDKAKELLVEAKKIMINMQIVYKKQIKIEKIQLKSKQIY